MGHGCCTIPCACFKRERADLWGWLWLLPPTGKQHVKLISDVFEYVVSFESKLSVPFV